MVNDIIRRLITRAMSEYMTEYDNIKSNKQSLNHQNIIESLRIRRLAWKN